MKDLLRILRLWRGRAGLLGIGAAVSLASACAGVALMTLSGAAVAAVLTGGLLAAPIWLRILGPARIGLRYLERLLTHDATFHALADLRVWFFRGLAARGAGGLGFLRAGDVLSRLVSDVEALDGLYLRILVPLACAAVLVPAAGLLAGRVTPLLGATVFLLLWAAAFMLPLLAASATIGSGENLAEAASRLRVAALDTLSGLREVRAFGAEARMTALIADRESHLFEAQRRVAKNAAFANAGSLLCGQAALLAVLATAGASPGPLVASIFLVTAAFELVAILPRAGLAAGHAAAAARRVLEVAEDAPTLPEPASPKIVPEAPWLRFAGVHFRWDPAKPPVFTGLTLEVAAGARVAILGPSGVGKSTLAALALRVVAPQAGKILLGGIDMTELAAADIRRNIAWLGQTTHLFDDTIRSNLLLGRPEASERELWDALDRAAIGEAVRALPDQLDTWLGESGAHLSGGQGRRIALARTLLSQAPILILDEPCAGLDADTERAFLTTLFAETLGRTIILIAHRLTGAERLERIWRLSAGHAVAAAG